MKKLVYFACSQQRTLEVSIKFIIERIKENYAIISKKKTVF